MTKIELRQIDGANWRECADLKVAPSQESFVTPNAVSLLEAAYDDELKEYLHPLAVYAPDDGDKMVGFVMYEDSSSPDVAGRGVYFIWRLMVGEHYQGRGYGRAALSALLQLLTSFEDCRQVGVTYDKKNVVAHKLYAGLGFIQVQRNAGDQTIGINDENEQLTAVFRKP
jgi:diamine N-acetyltransferase